jgi:hypothetical protein
VYHKFKVFRRERNGKRIQNENKKTVVERFDNKVLAKKDE